MRNKKRADNALILIFVIFLLVLLIRHRWPQVEAWHFLSFVVEAALVGGIADWFAITALFRRPLGIAAHTAIIPRNRQSLINAVAALVQDELLGPHMLQEQLKHINICKSIIKWEERQDWSTHLGDLLFEQLSRNDPLLNKMTDWLEVELRLYLRGQNVLPFLTRFTDSANVSGAIDRMLSEFTDYLEELASGPEVQIRIASILKSLFAESALLKIAGEQTILNNFVSGFVQDASEELHKHLLLRLREMRTPSDPARMVLRAQILSLIADYKQNSHQKKQLTYLCDEFIDQLPLHEILRKLPLQEWLNSYLASYWKIFKENQDLQQRINDFLGDNILWLLKSEYKAIGKIVQEVLDGLTDEELNQFVEAKVGEDLHWIRLNGSILGAISGSMLYLFLNFVYDPLVSPLILKWMKLL